MLLRIIKLRLRYFFRSIPTAFGFCPECRQGLIFDRDYGGFAVPRGWCPRCRTVKP